MPVSMKSNPRNLERVRINQQRSRDRKRAYISELESKVKLLEQALQDANQSNSSGDANQSHRSDASQINRSNANQTNQSDADQAHPSNSTDAMLTRVRHENRVRGDLLRVLGIDTETQDRFIRTAPIQLESNLVNSADTTPPSPAEEDQKHQESTLMDASVSALDRGTQFSALMSPLLSSHPSPIPSNLPLCSDYGTETQSGVLTAPSDSSTACSLAFGMVLSNNKRGYELVDLKSRMRVGYQKSMAPGEECRISNKVLFEVLAAIT